MAENVTKTEENEINDKTRTKKFLAIYCLAIFVFAVALILIAAFSQQRIERDAAALVAKAEIAETRAADKATLLDGAMTENARLKTLNTKLTTKNNELTTQVAGLERKMSALAALTKIVNYARTGDTLSKQTAITAFEENGYSGILTPEELAIYNSVK